ncbi:tyrosine aminotransferase [Meredithblackwellia eburnea MCA 4105]
MAPIALNGPEPIHHAPRTKQQPKAWAPVSSSPIVRSIRNPIREMMAGIDLGGTTAAAADGKTFLNLGLGDPSVFGNMPPHRAALDAIEESLRSGKADGYPESVGYSVAREAVANYFDEGETGAWRVAKGDVVMTHGASGALDMAFAVLASAGKNVIFPRPLFMAYETMITPTQAEVRYYDLLPGSNWEIDLAGLDEQIDENTAFVLINNPSNPCGSNWSESHLREIAALAARRQVVIVSDEVYGGMSWDVPGPLPASASAPRIQGKFNRGLFTPYAAVAGSAPVLVVGAVSKRWLAPGWRLGWVIVHDPLNVLAQVREGLVKWAVRIQGPNSTMQRALPKLLAETPESFFTDTMDTLSSVGKKLYERLEKIEGIEPQLPMGAMYLMAGGLTPANFPEFKNDAEFVKALMREENMLILPGSAFRLDGFIRFVTTVPLPVLLEACDRLEAFCNRHRGQPGTGTMTPPMLQ